MTTTFGPAWTGALLLGCESLGVAPAWTLAKIALESDFNPFARNASGARGLGQRMPANGVEYAVTDPVRQLNDAFTFWRAMRATLKVGEFRSREALYCLNLAPARLLGGQYDDETILYSANADDERLNQFHGRFERTYWPIAYQQNAAAFGLDPHDTLGRLRMRDLARGLDAAVARNRSRYDAELAACTQPTTWLGSAEQPDMRDPNASELDGDG